MVAREIAGLAQANLDALDLKEISIPIGTFTGLALLTGLGPDVTISVMPIGSALCDFVSYFIAAGINQTCTRSTSTFMRRSTSSLPSTRPP